MRHLVYLALLAVALGLTVEALNPPETDAIERSEQLGEHL